MRWFPLFVPVLCIAGLAAVAFYSRQPPAPPQAVEPTPFDEPVVGAPRYAEIPFDGAAAFGYLEAICKLGPRVSGTEGMRKQQDLVEKHFQELGAKVERQTFQMRHPQDGSAVGLTNLVVQWNPAARERYLLCAHYDTRPFPDRDPVDRQGTFVGANDGASGVAVLMELGKHIKDWKNRKGVDFVLFDAEELVYDESRDRYFVGSEHFARTYVATTSAVSLPPRGAARHGGGRQSRDSPRAKQLGRRAVARRRYLGGRRSPRGTRI
ncbi:MAG: M28 family peptidase [Pirellulales bacterium]